MTDANSRDRKGSRKPRMTNHLGTSEGCKAGMHSRYRRYQYRYRQRCELVLLATETTRITCYMT
jgi:hypothetical protein